MVTSISASELSGLKQRFPLIDVRSPLEFEQGHVPGALNIPLFGNEERAEVGTLYQQAGRDAALLKGLDIVGPKMSGFVKKLSVLCQNKPNELVLYCWRGGMRSNSVAWLLSTAGFQVHLLNGGYKSYRAYIRAQSGIGSPMIVLGGMTGSGKTDVLHHLHRMGEQVIDLENLASNKGSVFGYLGQPLQPTNEQFENNLYEEWRKLDHSKPVWLEDESRSIGAVSLPGPFFDRMKQFPMVLMNIPVELRVERLVKEYTGFDKSLLTDALSKIAQPLGGKDYTEASAAIGEGKFAPAITLVLIYYDKMYRKALQKFINRQIFEIKTNTGDGFLNAETVLKFKEKIVNLIPD